jgi:acetyltransferase-like isoleucine patch superfamily enzyme
MPVIIYHPEGLSLGDEVDVGEFVVLRASGGLTIGSRVLIAAHAVITTRGHPEEPPRHGRVVDAPVIIEDDVWIGAGAIVLPGVSIGRGSIVAAGAVVTAAFLPDRSERLRRMAPRDARACDRLGREHRCAARAAPS